VTHNREYREKKGNTKMRWKGGTALLKATIYKWRECTVKRKKPVFTFFRAVR